MADDIKEIDKDEEKNDVTEAAGYIIKAEHIKEIEQYKQQLEEKNNSDNNAAEESKEYAKLFKYTKHQFSSTLILAVIAGAIGCFIVSMGIDEIDFTIYFNWVNSEEGMYSFLFCSIFTLVTLIRGLTKLFRISIGGI